MRRLLGLITALVISVSFLAMPGSATAGVVWKVKSAQATNTTPGQSAHIEIAAAADSGVVGLMATLHLVRDSKVITTLTSFDLVSGTAQDGVWRSTDAVTVPDGRVAIEVKVALEPGKYTGYVTGGIIDNGRDVKVGELTASPDSLDSDHRDFRLTGRVVTQAADGTEEGAAHQTIELHDATRDLELGYTSTDDQGYFSATAQLSHAAYVEAVALGDGTYRSAKAQTVVHYTSLPTRLTINAPAEVVVGGTVTLSGRLEHQSTAGEWSGLGGATVSVLTQAVNGAKTDVVTGADGTYSARVTVRPGDLGWSAMFDGDMGTLGGYKPSNVDAHGFVIRTRPQIVDFDAGPEPVGRGATVTVRGRVLRPAANGGTEPAPQAMVDVRFSADGKKWSGSYATTMTDAHGMFSLKLTAQQDGYWKASVEKDDSYLAVTGPSDYVDTKYRTRISGINASPEPVRKGKRITVTGVLQRNTSSWKAFTGRSVKIYFRAKGGTKWTYAGTAKTSGSGRFTFGAKASKDEYWRATYAGDSADLAVTSGSDYVDVR